MQGGIGDSQFARCLVRNQALRGYAHRAKLHRKEQRHGHSRAPRNAAAQKFIPAITTGVTWPCRIGKATASKNAPFSKTPNPPDTPTPTECFTAAGLPWSHTDPAS